MTPRVAKRLARSIAREFAAPYLPEGFVRVQSYVWPRRVGRQRGRRGKRVIFKRVILKRRVVLSIAIGPRDADFDMVTGERLGGGTLILHGWTISGRPGLHLKPRKTRASSAARKGDTP